MALYRLTRDRRVISAETARKDEPAKKSESCFSDRREVIEVEEAPAELGVVAPSSSWVMIS